MPARGAALRAPTPCVASSEYTWCSCQTGHFSGLPGSVRFTRAGSVGMVRIFFVTDSGSSRSAMVLP